MYFEDDYPEEESEDNLDLTSNHAASGSSGASAASNSSGGKGLKSRPDPTQEPPLGLTTAALPAEQSLNEFARV